MTDFAALKIIVQVQVRPHSEDQNLKAEIQSIRRMVATRFRVDPLSCSTDFREGRQHLLRRPYIVPNTHYGGNIRVTTWQYSNRDCSGSRSPLLLSVLPVQHLTVLEPQCP